MVETIMMLTATANEGMFELFIARLIHKSTANILQTKICARRIPIRSPSESVNVVLNGRRVDIRRVETNESFLEKRPCRRSSCTTVCIVERQRVASGKTCDIETCQIGSINRLEGFLRPNIVL